MPAPSPLAGTRVEFLTGPRSPALGTCRCRATIVAAALLALAACDDAEPDSADGGLDAAVDAAVDAAIDAGPPLCGDPLPVGEDDVASGSRVCARFAVGDGGREWLGMHDALRGEACTVMATRDGYRCVGGVRPASIFADAACTVPLFESNAPADACAPPADRLYTATWPCDAPVVENVFERGREIVPAFHFRGSITPGTRCTPEAVQPGVTYHEAVPVALAEYARFDVVEDPIEGRLFARRLVGADGASVPHTLFDDQLGAACIARPDGSAYRCRLDAPIAWARADADCTTLLADQGLTCPAPRYLLDHDPFDRNVYRAIPTEPRTSAFMEVGPFCASTSTPADRAYYIGGVALPLPMADLEVAPRDTGGRLQPLAETAPGLSRDLAWLYDRDLGMPCRSELYPDGTLRCTPTPCYRETTLYTDDACTQPFTGAERFGICTLYAADVLARATPPVDACHAGHRLTRVGALHPRPYYRRVSATRCEAVSGSTRIYDLGAELAADDLALMTEVMQ